MTGESAIQVRDIRNGSWAWANNMVISDHHLTAAEVRVYMALASFGGCAEIRPSVPTVAERACTSYRTAQTALRKLEQVAYIRIERPANGSGPNVYYLLRAAKGCLLCRNPRKTCTPAESTGAQKGAETPAENCARPPQNLPTNKTSELNKNETSSPDSPSATPGRQELFNPQSANGNGKLSDPELVSIVHRLVPFFLEKSGKRSYALNSRPSRGKSTRMLVLVNGLKLLRGALQSQSGALAGPELQKQTENAARFIVEEFSKSDRHKGRDQKTKGTAYDDPAVYAFCDMATMEKWLNW